MQLAQWQDRFETLGVNVAGMTYDSQETLAEFHAKESLGYPLLRDVDQRHVSALGVLNEDYGPGHAAFGVPHPGIVYIDANGIVRAKFAAQGYRSRPPFEAVFAAVSQIVGEQ